MNDDSLVASRPDVALEHEVQEAATKHSEIPEDAIHIRTSAESVVSAKINGSSAERSNGDTNVDKSDSEAETVVLSGREESQDHQSKKAIKLEETGRAESVVSQHPESVVENQEREREGSREIEVRNTSLKRKRVTLERGTGDIPDGGNSSNLSSTISSPVQEARSSKATDSASNRSRSSPPLDEVAQEQERRIGKLSSGIKSAQSLHSGGKSDRGSEFVAGRKRRDTRSATHYDEPIHRSVSPPSRNNKRAQSIQSSHPQPGITKRRRAPAPLHVERRNFEDPRHESDDDSSGHSHHHLQKPLSARGNAISPAKMVSQKKNRDRNGRTLLARACQHGDYAEAVKWLTDRPQDINLPDNAGNTPFQIAALDGSAEVVQLLLNAGCDINCRNIDKDTPLIDAVENGNLAVVEMLLKAGLDPRQTNAFGKEPLDLIKAEKENADEIREALLASKKEKAFLRRPSEDNNRQHSAGSRDAEMTTGSAAGASPGNSNRSPPPMALGARRRTARSQPTNDALLWVNATPARLRDAAGKGDTTIVDHILKMRPQADTESVLAAARGGHDTVLSLMLAVAQTDPDPDPLNSGEYQSAYSTPMLAAIGRGNTSIINLLLSQPGFNPTRRLYRNMTYFDIAKERQGSEWHEEYDLLKQAFEEHVKYGGRKSNNSSPHKVRKKRANSTKSGSEPSSSPQDARKSRKPSTLTEESSDGNKRASSQKGVARKKMRENRKQTSPALASDHDSTSLGPPKSKGKEGKLSGEKNLLMNKRADSLKPRRRLMSGNEYKTDQDMRRRASLAAEPGVPAREAGDSVLSGRQRRFSDVSESVSKVTPERHSITKDEMGKKRHRLSVSPHASKSDPITGTDIKKKKRRVDSQGNAIDQDRDRAFRPGAPAMVANMIAIPPVVTSPSVSQGTAPVAFMGSNVGSPVTKSPSEVNPQSTLTSPVNSIDQAISQRQDLEEFYAHNHPGSENMGQQQSGQEPERGVPEVQSETVLLEHEKRQHAQTELQRRVQAESEDSERQARIAHEEEEARLEEQRHNAEAERQIREQEESQAAKLKRDEEAHQRLLEQEQIRKDEQERKRRDLEEKENLQRLRFKEEEELQRLQSLPNGLRRVAELSPEEAKDLKQMNRWLPLRTVTTEELDPSLKSHAADERWIANFQAAALLAVKDLNLSQYTAWTRLPATMNQRGSLFRHFRNYLSECNLDPWTTPTEAVHLDWETQPKFFTLEPVFWIKLSDFMDIVPLHQHLAGLPLSKIREITMHEFPFGKGGTWDGPGKARAEEAAQKRNRIL